MFALSDVHLDSTHRLTGASDIEIPLYYTVPEINHRIRVTNG